VLREENYLGASLTAIEQAQQDEAAKRIERANKRIAALKAEKKELEGKAGSRKKKAGKDDKASIAKGIKSLLRQPDEDKNEQDHDDEEQ